MWVTEERPSATLHMFFLTITPLLCLDWVQVLAGGRSEHRLLTTWQNAEKTLMLHLGGKQITLTGECYSPRSIIKMKKKLYVCALPADGGSDCRGLGSKTNKDRCMCTPVYLSSYMFKLYVCAATSC